MKKGWKKVRLGDVVSLNYGKALTSFNRMHGSIPIYSSAGITGYHDKPLVESAGIIIGRKGTIGTVYYSSVPFFCIDTAYFILPSENFDLKYMYYRLRSLGLEKLNEDSAVPGLNRETAYNQSFYIPPISGQRDIASILSCLDDKIEFNTKINHHLEQMAQAVFKSWFVNFEPSRPFTDIIQVLGGGTPKTTVDDYWGGSIPFFTPKDALTTYVSSTEKSLTEVGLKNCNSHLYPVNTVFVTARGTVGKIALAGIPMAMNQSCYALVGIEGYGQHFVYHLTLEVVNSLKHKAFGAVFDAIVTRDFESEIVPVPSLDAVKSFEEKVVPIYASILNNSNESVRLATIRDTLLPRLMSGDLSVSDLEPAK